MTTDRALSLPVEHPDYDQALEMLCSIAGADMPIPLSLLARDFGLPVQADVRRILRSLTDHGIAVDTFRSEDGLGISCRVVPSCRHQAVAVAQRYWDQVHGPQPVAA